MTVGGSGVGGALLRRVMAAYPEAKRCVPELRMIAWRGRGSTRRRCRGRGARGAALRPRPLPPSGGMRSRGGAGRPDDVDGAHRQPATVHLLPAQHHFEQNFHVRHRLERYGAGRRMDFDDSPPEAIAEAIAQEIGREVDYRPVETDGARRAAERIAELLNGAPRGRPARSREAGRLGDAPTRVAAPRRGGVRTAAAGRARPTTSAAAAGVPRASRSASAGSAGRIPMLRLRCVAEREARAGPRRRRRGPRRARRGPPGPPPRPARPRPAPGSPAPLGVPPATHGSTPAGRGTAHGDWERLTSLRRLPAAVENLRSTRRVTRFQQRPSQVGIEPRRPLAGADVVGRLGDLACDRHRLAVLPARAGSQHRPAANGASCTVCPRSRRCRVRAEAEPRPPPTARHRAAQRPASSSTHWSTIGSAEDSVMSASSRSARCSSRSRSPSCRAASLSASSAYVSPLRSRRHPPRRAPARARRSRRRGRDELVAVRDAPTRHDTDPERSVTEASAARRRRHAAPGRGSSPRRASPRRARAGCRPRARVPGRAGAG